MTQNPKQIAILGCGTIGASWTALVTAFGHDARVWDPSPDFAGRLERQLERNHQSLGELGQLSAQPGRVTIAETAADAVAGAQFVQESAIEDLSAKQALYQSIAPAMAADAILASSTSFLMPSDLQADSAFAERICIGHPFNPPHLIPLVEVVGGKLTTSNTLDQAVAFYQSIGKRVVRLKKEATGHLVNRLQAALWREAVHAVTDGIADLADVDAAIAYGPGLRWALMGPHLTFHLAGGDGGMTHFIDHLGPVNETAWADLGSPQLDAATTKTLIEGCATATNGMSVDDLRQRRDAQLLALLKNTERVL